MKIVELTDEQMEQVENGLQEFDYKYVTYQMEGQITIGLEENGKIIAGLLACITVYKILYVSTVFVEEEYRKQGYGKMLMEEMEKRAKEMGVNMIRLDTFNWQGKDFYEALGYQQVGCYKNEEDDFEEYFFLKKI